MENAMAWLYPITVDVEDSGQSRVNGFSLNQNYPNPFNPITLIDFDLHKAASVSIQVYELSGNEVSVLVSEAMQAGHHQVQWDAGHLPSGVYLIRLEAEGYFQVRKCMLMK